MNYIVFDLEWNQSPDGKKSSNSRLPFEIIEIGAVKLNEKKEVTGTFHRLIKPQVYKWIHNSIHEIIHVNYKDLADGMPFPRAVREFIEWCGQDWSFFTWGNQDVGELQRNMKYYELLPLLPGPVIYYDVQKLFALCSGEPLARRSLEYAINMTGVRKNHDFHRALEDAHYTAEILKRIGDEYIFPNASLDVYQNPKSRSGEIYISHLTCEKYVSREFSTRDRVMKDREVTSTRCPVCGSVLRRKLRWFTNNSKTYYSVFECPEHGDCIGKIRVRRTDEEKYFAVKTLKKAEPEEAEEIRAKRDSIRHRKKSRGKLGEEV